MLIKYLIQAYHGKLIWKKIRKKHGEGYYPSRYIIFPSEDDEYNAWGLYLMPYYLKDKHLDKITIISCDEELIQASSCINHYNLHIECREEMDCLIRLFALVNINDEWTIVSVKEPYDTGAERLLGKKGVTKRAIIWYDVYRMDKRPHSIGKINLSSWERAGKYLKYLEAEADQV